MPMTQHQKDILRSLRKRGFDLSKASSDSPRACRVRCSQCQAMVVNGVAIHERGCPNEKHGNED